jgi:hypothetical protein
MNSNLNTKTITPFVGSSINFEHKLKHENEHTLESLNIHTARAKNKKDTLIILRHHENNKL